LFPGIQEILQNAGPIAWDHLISPLELKLPATVLQRAQAAVTALHSVSRRPEYLRKSPPQPGVSEIQVRHESVLMAYDFHTREDGECSLVEVNTNASGFLVASLMAMVHGEVSDLGAFGPLNDLRKSFEEELRRIGNPTARPHIAIVDEDIPQQKMFVEFLMYRDWFHSLGWAAELSEPKDLVFADRQLSDSQGRKVDFVYNRLTDFYFENPEHAALAAAFREQASCVSPSPSEYWRLADKQRLIEFSQNDFLESVGATAEEIEAIRRVLIPTFEISNFESHDEIWQQRRNLFFKPKRSHGGKSVYRGESVSRKVFERLMSEDILIQRFTPAQKMPIDDERSVLNNWKFDLRCFVYADRIQMCAARIYQGQVTNFSSPLGGFTLVRF
jgi:hypothetical protein